MQVLQNSCLLNSKSLLSCRGTSFAQSVKCPSKQLPKPQAVVACEYTSQGATYTRFSDGVNRATQHLTESNSLINPNASAIFNSISYTPALVSATLNVAQNYDTWKFGQDIIAAIQVKPSVWYPMLTPWTPANCIVASQVGTFQSLDRPAFGSGQGLGYVLAATGLYIVMLASSLFFGTVRKFPSRKNRQTRKRRSLKSARTKFATSVRPYILQIPVTVSRMLLQRDPPMRLQRYPTTRLQRGLRSARPCA
mmetsp:Transcript_2788/g.3790  ORF Transcript_2788/g.3790 Transcript_2788/m.3790 type:complete len:251 (-) Transcript_2788:807-1559(-)